MKNKRYLYLVIGMISMLFAGVIYAWSILKVSFSEFNWTAPELSLNYTLTMCCFCLGGLLGSLINKKIGSKLTTIIAAVLTGLGFVLTGTLNGESIFLLYIYYAVMSGLGIGIVYNVIISTVCAHFPDKKGFCSGCLMMGFGASTLLIGNLASLLFESDAFGWRKTYMFLGIVMGLILIVAGIILKVPSKDEVIKPVQNKKVHKEDFEIKDYTTKEMLGRFSFWRVFLCLICLTAVGSSVISFAKDLAQSVGAEASLATTLVGVLSVCNGLGRIIVGILFDKLGRRFTMIFSNILTMAAAGCVLLAVSINSLVLCIIGLVLVGMSYGSCPTVASAITSAFYGQKNFSRNFSVMNFNLMIAAFIATGCSTILTNTGGYLAPFILLLSLTGLALILNLSIKRP
ncbi:MAG: MFS transporter [Bacilli bacterium]|nr:MFS transporter [Bacilli bacterium]